MSKAHGTTDSERVRTDSDGQQGNVDTTSLEMDFKREFQNTGRCRRLEQNQGMKTCKHCGPDACQKEDPRVLMNKIPNIRFTNEDSGARCCGESLLAQKVRGNTQLTFLLYHDPRRTKLFLLLYTDS